MTAVRESPMFLVKGGGGEDEDWSKGGEGGVVVCRLNDIGFSGRVDGGC